MLETMCKNPPCRKIEVTKGARVEKLLKSIKEGIKAYL